MKTFFIIVGSLLGLGIIAWAVVAVTGINAVSKMANNSGTNASGSIPRPRMQNLDFANMTAEEMSNLSLYSPEDLAALGYDMDSRKKTPLRF